MTTVDLSNISVGYSGVFSRCPEWFSAFVNFAASFSMDLEYRESEQNLSILSVPKVRGVVSALSLGALYGEVSKVRSQTSLTQISVEELKLGMQVSVLCGTGGHQAVGEITKLDINDKTPKVTVGKVTVSIKAIREIYLLSGQIGKPKQFKKMEKSSNSDPNSLFGVLADSSLPIFRSLLMLRSTSGITEEEFSLELRDDMTGETKSLRDLMNPIQASSKNIGTTVVLNTSEEDQVEWLMQQLELSEADASPEIAVIGSASAILSQLENIENSKVLAVIGRNERQINAAADVIRNTFAYSYEVSKKSYWEMLPSNTELVSFGRPR
jgi:hypothetical protein